MRILNITDLRKWSKDNRLQDSWWVSVNGRIIDDPIKLIEVPREGDVLLLNTSISGADKEEWIVCRYPGYKTQAEKSEIAQKERLKNLPTAKQILALEFFGHNKAVTRQEATVLLDKYFLLPNNYGRYQDFLWDHYERLYTGRELYEKTFHRLQNQMFLIKQSAPKDKIESIIIEAIESSIPYKCLIDLVRNRYPEILYADSSQKQKTSEYESYNRKLQNYKAEQMNASKSGCLKFLIYFIVPSIISFIFTSD